MVTGIRAIVHYIVVISLTDDVIRILRKYMLWALIFLVGHYLYVLVLPLPHMVLSWLTLSLS